MSWGAAVGGMTTPLGGGQAVVTLSFLREVHPARGVLPRLDDPDAAAVAAGHDRDVDHDVLLHAPEITEFKGSKDYYRRGSPRWAA